MVRWRGDEADARCREAEAGDDLVHLAAGKLTALPGLGPLGDLDLQVVGADQVVGGDPEPSRRPPA